MSPASRAGAALPLVLLLLTVVAFTPARGDFLAPAGADTLWITKSFNGIDSIPDNTRAVTFTLHWSGAEGVVDNISYSVTCSGAASCTQIFGEVTMSTQNPTINVPITYSTAATGSGSVIMTAQGFTTSANSEILVQLPASPAGFTVEPSNGSTSGAWDPSIGAGTGSASFVITNTSSSTATYTWQCWGENAVITSCPGGSQQLNPAGFTVVNVGFMVWSSGRALRFRGKSPLLHRSKPCRQREGGDDAL